VSPKLLPRPSTRPAPRAGNRTRTGPAATPLGVSVSPSPARVLRRPAVLALVAAGAVAVAGLGWTQLRSSAAEDTVQASVLVRPRPASTPAPGATAAATPTTQGDLLVGRDPFSQEPAAAVTAPTTSPHVLETALPSPSGEPTTTQPGPTDGALPQPSTSGAPSAAPRVTVTVTAPGSPTYVGLYAWNGSRASFRVNARTYSVPVGAHFGAGLTFTDVVRGDPPCARVTHAKGSFTLCPGQVTTLP
jgi:hypothetical protein